MAALLVLGVTMEPTLDCQQCGTPLLELSPAQERMVADNPYNYIVYCPPCAKMVGRKERM